MAALSLATSRAQPSSRPPAPVPETIACRVLEAHTSEQQRVAVVIFHQRNTRDRAQLGTLLRKRSGVSVEFQTTDGKWHTGTVLRLKSCFGRGLLLFPAGTAEVAEQSEFLLKFPAD